MSSSTKRLTAMFFLMIVGSGTAAISSLALNRGWVWPLGVTAFLGPMIAGVATSFYVTAGNWRERMMLAVVQGTAHSIGAISVYLLTKK